MTSNRPYLVRALWQWITDNGLTPHLVVDANREGVEVPRDFVDDGRIVLNISASAVRDLEMENDFISFNARFSGAPMNILVPLPAVLGIYAQENGQGMLFPESDEETPPPTSEPPDSKAGRPSLKIVR